MSGKTETISRQDFAGQIEAYLGQLKSVLDLLQAASIRGVVQAIRAACEADRTIFLMGNGGSASTASHMACDFGKGLSESSGLQLKVVSLNDNVPSILAIANDISYDSIFVEQLRTLLRPGDLVIGISGSGKSRNITRALEYANERGAVTVGFCGFDGGEVKKLAKLCIHVPVADMQIAEDVHLILGHICFRLLRQACICQA